MLCLYPKNSARVERNEAAVNMEMIGIPNRPEEIIPLEEWEFIRKYILNLVDVDVPVKLIHQVVSPFAPVIVSCTPANAMHVLRS